MAAVVQNDGPPKISISLSWDPGNAENENGGELSQYMVQLDEKSPVLVQTPLVTLFSDVQSDYTVQIRAIDMCRQTSDAAIVMISGNTFSPPSCVNGTASKGMYTIIMGM